MADQQRDGSENTLTEREREALQELARNIVSESGIVSDPEDEARLEATKLAAESAKTNVLISSGALVGIATLVGVLPGTNHTTWLLIAILLVIFSVLESFRRMEDLSERIAARREPTLGKRSALGPPLLGLGLLAFCFYVVYNIPWNGEVWFMDMTRDQFVWGSVICGVLLAGILRGRNLFKRVRRSNEAKTD